MKHIFIDDGQPEARDFDDNYSNGAPRPVFAVARQWRRVKPDDKQVPLEFSRHRLLERVRRDS